MPSSLPSPPSAARDEDRLVRLPLHICRVPADPCDWHLDHVVPLAGGGEHSYANTAVSHPICNRKKGSKVSDQRLGWHDYYLGIARAVAARADCSRAQHGAVIVQGRKVVSTGYNGAPSGKPGCLTAGACPRALLSYDQLASGSSYDTGPGACIAIHAEANAMLRCAWEDMQGATMYVTGACCQGCSKLVMGSGICAVIWPGGTWVVRDR